MLQQASVYMVLHSCFFAALVADASLNGKGRTIVYTGALNELVIADDMKVSSSDTATCNKD